MSESFPILSEAKNLGCLRRGQEIEARRNESPHLRGVIDDIDLDQGVIWIHDALNERKMIDTSEFSVWRYIF